MALFQGEFGGKTLKHRGKRVGEKSGQEKKI